MIRFGCILVLAMAFGGCSPNEAKPAAAQAATAGPPALSVVTAAGEAQLMFRYQADAGWQTADTIEAVPAAARALVQVVDLSRPPAERGAGKWVQLTDLRTPQADGTYPSRWVAHADLEGELARKAAEKPKAKPVIMYSASWCGYCRKARKFLGEEGIAFTEKDIEKDKAAARELQSKAAKAGVQASGVPVFDVGGRILPGFDPDALLNAVRGT